MSAEELTRTRKVLQRRAVELGYPEEAFEEEALFWAYVSHYRGEYDRVLKEAGASNSAWQDGVLRRMRVDSSLIQKPLSDKDKQKINAWKLAYLQRLQREEADKSYIDAYLKAWSFSPREAINGLVR